MFGYNKVVCANTGMLLTRVGVGLVLFVNGWNKVNDVAGTVGFFGEMNIPAVIAYLVIAIEVLGGLALILGLWTKWAGLLIAAVMLGAIILVTGKMGFAGYQLNLVLLTSALGVALGGPGTYTVHRLLGMKQE